MNGATWEGFSLTPTSPPIENGGQIYSIALDGSEFQTIRDIDVPISSLAVLDGKIFGLEDIAAGTLLRPDGPAPRNLFSMNTDGSNYEVLHEFEGIANDGQNATRVVASGDHLFGITRTGDLENAGTIFRRISMEATTKSSITLERVPSTASFPTAVWWSSAPASTVQR